MLYVVTHIAGMWYAELGIRCDGSTGGKSPVALHLPVRLCSYKINLLLSIVFGGFIYLIFTATISYFDKSAVNSLKNSYFLKNSIEK